MSDIRQLPGSYIETFREAVEAIDDFGRGGRERSVTSEGRPVRVGYIIGVASQYRVPAFRYDVMRARARLQLWRGDPDIADNTSADWNSN